jgi:hypothetical protein
LTMTWVVYGKANREVAEHRTAPVEVVPELADLLTGRRTDGASRRRLARRGTQHTPHPPVVPSPQIGAPLHKPGQHLSTLCKDSSRRIA